MTDRAPLRQIGIYGHSVSLPCDLIMHPALQTVSPAMPGDARAGRESLIISDGRDPRRAQNCHFQTGSAHPARGLQPVLRQIAAAETGIELRTTPLAKVPEPLGSYTKTGLAEFVFQNELGLIRYVRKWHPEVEVIKELALRFPGQRIVVLSDRIEQLRKAARQLRPTLGGEVACLPDWRSEVAPRVALSRFSDWNRPVTEMSQADIVLLLKASDVVHLRAINALIHPDHQFRLYGLLPFSARMSRETLDRVTAAFGFAHHWLADAQTQWRPQSIAWQPLHIQFDSNGKSDFQVMEEYFWATPRNKRVIRLARQIANNSDASTARRVLEGLDGQSARIVLLASNAEQARDFARRLGWSLVTGTLGESRHGSSPHFVLMPSAIDDFRLLPDIVINASPTVPRFPAHWFTMPSRHLRPIKLVDFHDSRCDKARKLSRRRKFTYEALDIFEAGKSPSAERLRCFVQSRPKPRRGEGATR